MILVKERVVVEQASKFVLDLFKDSIKLKLKSKMPVQWLIRLSTLLVKFQIEMFTKVVPIYISYLHCKIYIKDMTF